MRKKIVFFDIDGTIYSFKSGMPNDTKLAIKMLKENGHIPVICTGRTKCMIYPSHKIDEFEHFIAGGGTYVEINGKEEFYYQMPEEDVLEIIEAYNRHNFIPIAEGRDWFYIGTDTSDIVEKNKKVLQTYRENMPSAIVPIDGRKIEASKVSSLFTNHSDLESIRRQFSDRYHIINHNGYLLELLPKQFNKAVGIEIMLDKLNMRIEDTYAFGDSFNDIDMLKYVANPCVMGNATKDLKIQFDCVTDRYDEGGIYNGLKRFGLI